MDQRVHPGQYAYDNACEPEEGEFGSHELACDVAIDMLTSAISYFSKGNAVRAIERMNAAIAELGGTPPVQS